jgi:23S rRNA pseudouridine1911/1915/1917 synthase
VVVHGRVAREQGAVDAPIGRDPRHRQRMAIRPAGLGRPAVTHYRVLERFEVFTLLEARLETGRTHQIRMHFAEAGFPLISDTLYGPKKAQRPDLIARQALHAWKLTFAHPRTGKVLTFTAPPPRDFQAAQKRLAAP